ncbi:hypothetical protein N8Z61_06545 [Candidatus Thioglobus sp.]|jgi:hypothetical protein|nr:hypothetical protein [Candidatus Thioglobus sp.]
MSIYQIEGLKISIADGNGPYEVQDGVSLIFPDEAEKELDKFLSKYDIDIEFTMYFDDLKANVWACICFSEEQDIAGHVLSSREHPSQLVFKPYSANPDADRYFVPKVGSMYISSKLACEDLSHNSELFLEIWNQLKDCDRSIRWLLIMHKIPETVNAISKEENNKLWYKNRTF